MQKKTQNKRAHKKGNSLLPCIPAGSSPNFQGRLGAPKFKLIKENTLRPKETNFGKLIKQIKETVGTEEIDFFATLIT